MKLIRYAVIGIIISSTLCGCSIKRFAMNRIADMAETGLSAFEMDSDTEMLKKAFPANIKLFEALLANDPENRRLLVLLSQLYGCYAFAFFENEIDNIMLFSELTEADREAIEYLQETTNRYYQKGMNYAMRALETRHRDFPSKLGNIKTANDSIETLPKKDIPALFWYAFNLGAYINRNKTSLAAVSNGFIVEKAMQRVVELEPSFFYGGAHLFLLSYESRSPMLGGNDEKARYHYQELKKIAGDDFLLADLFYAQFYLYQRQERQQFQDTLIHIIHFNKAECDYQLFNQVAKNRAINLIYQINQLFEKGD